MSLKVKKQKKERKRDREMLDPETSNMEVDDEGAETDPIEADNLESSVHNTSGVSDSFPTSSAVSDMSDVDDELAASDPSEVLEMLEYRVLSKDRVLMGLPAQAELYFKGCLQVKVLKGQISTQGYILSSGDGYTPVYSPRGHSLLCIRAVNGCQSDEDLHNRLTSESLDPSSLPSTDVLFVAKKLNEPWIEFLRKSLKTSEKINLFGRDGAVRDGEPLSDLEKCLDISLFKPSTAAKLWRQGQDWTLALTSVNIVKKSGHQPRLLAAGGKGVGKSSFLRWMTNQLVQDGDILFLDLDPGQKEFGLPGYLTLCLINQPLLGPNFCQSQCKWERSVYFGDVNVSNNPGRYIGCVRLLVELCREYSTVPLLVNTMGWCQGLGLLLTTDIIRLTEPTTVVQLLSRFPKKNFPTSLRPEFVSNTKSSWSKSPKQLTYTHLEFLAVPERRCAKDMRSNDSWGIPKPNILRDIQTLAWFGRRGGVKDLPVYSIHFSHVCLDVVHDRVPPHGLLAALLLKPVDLCCIQQNQIKPAKSSEDYSILKSSAVSESVGTGVVRGVDTEKRLIFLATNVDESILKSVNCLVGGSLMLPSGLLSKQKVPSPYLTSDQSANPLDLPWQRNHKYGQFSA